LKTFPEAEVRIALIQPPLRDFYLTPHRMSVLGLTLVQSILEEAGHELVLYNFPRSGSASTIGLPESLGYLKQFIIEGERGPLSGFSLFRRFGPDYREAASIVLAGKPDLVLIGLFAWAYGEDAAAMAGALRELSPELSIGAGGAGISVDPERFRSTGLFDMLFTGEAENGLDRLAGSLRSFLPSAFYDPEKKSISLSASRGCPMQCRFCANHLVHGGGFRLAAPDEVLAQMDTAFRRAGGSGSGGSPIEHIYFEDDNLSADRSWFRELLTAVHKRYPDARISAENGIDYRFLDPGDLAFMRDKGFCRMNYSIASVEPAQREALGRGAGSLERYIALVKEGARLGLDAVTYFIAGLPGEKPARAVENLLFLLPLPTSAGISLFYPVPGIEGFEEPAQYDGIPLQRALGSAAWPWGGGYTTAQLLTAFRLSRAANVLGDGSSDASGRLLAEAMREESRLLTLSGKERKLQEIPWADRGMSDLFFSGLRN
jgi:radical SAM superfamily enzyme YgiQ (UPF0313 family)